jgi:hypothetical protein
VGVGARDQAGERVDDVDAFVSDDRTVPAPNGSAVATHVPPLTVNWFVSSRLRWGTMSADTERAFPSRLQGIPVGRLIQVPASCLATPRR